MSDFKKARAESKRLNRPLLIHFYAEWCGPCRRMDADVLYNQEFLKTIRKQFVAVKLDIDDHLELAEQFSVRSVPSDVFAAPSGKVLTQSTGYQGKQKYLAQLARVDAEWGRSQKLLLAKQNRSKTGIKISPASPIRRDNPGMKWIASNPQKPGRAAPQHLSKNPAGHRVKQRVGLGGYCPVSLWHQRKWQRGKEQFALSHRGIIYKMASVTEWRLFKAKPGQYVPRLLGCDPVILWDTDRAVAGHPKYAAYFDRELYLFASAETRARFRETPRRFVRNRQVLRVDQIERNNVR